MTVTIGEVIGENVDVEDGQNTGGANPGSDTDLSEPDPNDDPNPDPGDGGGDPPDPDPPDPDPPDVPVGAEFFAIFF